MSARIASLRIIIVGGATGAPETHETTRDPGEERPEITRAASGDGAQPAARHTAAEPVLDVDAQPLALEPLGPLPRHGRW